ncbi:MAG: amino acid adenylation domain-containing protein [Actinoallomurus sp.]
MSITENGATVADQPDEGTGRDEESGQDSGQGSDEVLEASFAQERLWFLDRLSSGSGEYLLGSVWRVRGRLDRRAWQDALDRMAARHEVLRTSLVEVDGRPMQRIAAEVSVPVGWHETPDLPAGHRTALALEDAARLCATSVDLARAPLVRCGVWVLDQDESIVAVVFHHAVCDGLSTRVFADELVALYEEESGGPPAELPELTVQYADFAAWQREWLTGATLERQLGYWRDALDGAGTLELPADRTRPAVRSGRGATVDLTLPARLVADLEELGRDNRATLFMVLLAAYQLVLARWSGRDDIVVGTPIAGRGRKELERLIGLFLNTLAIRADLSGEPTFAEHLARVRATVLDVFDHQDLPFERLVEELRPERDLGHNPIFQSWFVLENPVPPRQREGTISLSPISLDGGSVFAPFDISLLAQPVAGGLRLVFTYAIDLFDAATIERFAGHLRRVLDGVAEAPRTPVAAVDLLTTDERAVLAGFAGSDRETPADGRTVLERFAAQVARAPGAVAVRGEDDSLTYGALDARADAVARALRDGGMAADPRVGVCVSRGLGSVVALLGAWKAGAAYVPLDPAYPEARLRYMAADAGLSAVVTDAAHRESAAGLLADAAPVVLDDLDDRQSDEPAVPSRTDGDRPAYVIYTSGSTGEPKGVVVGHAALARHVAAAQERFGIAEADRVLAFASFSFDASLDQVLPALTTGARVVVRPDTLWLPARLPEIIRRYGVTVANLTPAYWAEVVAELSGPAAGALAGLRLLVLGGEAVPPRPLATWRAAVPHVTVVNAYGPTESVVTAGACTVEGPVPERVPIGRPLAGRRMHVLDATGRPTPVGVPGELYVAGPVLAYGYRGRPGLTAERFVPDPYGTPGSRMYRTGDRARWRPDGNLEFLGRLDDQVKLRGFRVELGEISAAIARHPDVTAATVAVRADAPGGRLTAYAVTTAPLTHTDLTRWCARTLPDHMIPGATVVLPELPLLPSGKVDRDALPAPEHASAEPAAAYVAPRDPVEQAIADIWAEVLGVPRVGIDDGFFDLGGHSLLATMAISRIARRLDREVELRTLFEKPRIRDFAPEVAASGGVGGGWIVPVGRGGTLVPSFAQERLWFLDRLSESGGEYQLWNTWRVRGELDRGAWQGALDDVAARHEVLRTALVEVGGRPMQRIAAQMSVPVDWHETPEDLARVRQEAARFVAFPFDLSRAPLVRCGVWRLNDGDLLVAMAFHHVVSDGWSAAVFAADLTACYEARINGVPAALPEIPVQYADFAAWQREWLTGDTLDRRLGYWRETLDGVTALDLPADHPRPAVRTAHGGTVRVDLPAGLAADLEALGRANDATLFMVLLAAAQVVLARWSGRDDVTVGTPIAGRGRAETEGLIGFFVNTLVIRADLTGDPAFTEHLARVRERVLGALDHQDLPFERIVEELRPRRDLGQNPLFQVLFDVNDREPAGFTAGDARFTSVEVPRETAKFDLSLAFNTHSGEFSLEIEYATDLFEQSTVRRMAGHVENVLREIRECAGRTVRGLELTTAGERAALDRFAGPSGKTTPEPGVLERFAGQAARSPGAVALTFEDRSLTYAELDARAGAVARALRDAGAGTESRVGLCTGRGAEAVAALLGVWKAGAAFVPLDPAYPEARLRFMAADAGLSAVVTDLAHRDLAALLPPESAPIVLEHVLAEPGTGEEPVRPDPGRLAYVIYTSGSTGEPKGVAVSHGSLARHVAAARELFGLAEADRVLQFASFSFDASLEQLLPALTTGARVVVRPDEVWTPEELCARVRDERITVMELVPAYWETLVTSLTGPSIEALASLRLLVTGGEAADTAVAAAWCERLPGVPVVNTYGPTEGTISATSYVITGPPSGRIPIGRPLGERRLHVLDAGGRPAPVGVPGELYIAGPELARGYLHRPALTAERFVPDPYGQPGSRMYRTGDRARWRPDGNLEFLGRLDDQVKLRGFRVELGEVEATLARHPGVTAAATAVRPTGRGTELVAYVVTTAPLTPAELRTWCARTLPGHMVPGVTVTLPELPLLPSGKLDRGALPEPGPDDGEGADEEVVAPRSPTEDVIAGIWAEILALDEVGVTQDFFALGGHSLRAAMAASRLGQAFGCAVKVRDVFENPTVAALSLRVEHMLIEEIAAMSEDEVDLSLQRDL